MQVELLQVAPGQFVIAEPRRIPSPVRRYKVDLARPEAMIVSGLIGSAILSEERCLRINVTTYNEEAHAFAGAWLTRLRDAQEAFRRVLYPTSAEVFSDIEGAIRG